MNLNSDSLRVALRSPFLFKDCEKRSSLKCTCACCDRKPLMKCCCNERVIYLNRGEIILKSKLLKVNNGIAMAKCKRCGNWIEVPLQLSVKLGTV